ncbi:type II secretion system F family protein [Pseudoduganella sp. RAF53_2]|uniref:type II secretion system F family protein n=1 Tax=unclassified Pseudoduganella TaxID=2637179 RepID=UPI003F998F70
MDYLLPAFSVLLFAAVIFMVEGAWLWWSSNHGSGARRIAKRLRLMAGRSESGGDNITILKQRRYADAPWLESLLHRVPRVAVLDRLLLQSGLRWQVGRFLGCSALAVMMSMLLPRVLDLHAIPAGIVMLSGAWAPVAVLMQARRRRMRKVEQQLPDLADFLARALRAGHSFANVLQMAGEEMPEPLGGEFRATYEEINFGVSMNEALHNLAARVPLTDLRYLVIAVLIQRESGGNLAELLDNVSRMTRARLKLLGQVRVQSAEGRLSAWVLSALPVGVLGIMSITNPAYVAVLWNDPAGVKLLWYAVGAVAVGVLWMRSLVRIKL